jgi:capsular exopolysaccharide synthesis family protein
MVAHHYYTAVSRVQVAGTNKALGLDSFAGSNSVGDALETNNILQTQLQIIQSETIALRVIKDLGLESDPGFATSEKVDTSSPLESSPKRLDHVLSVFSQRLGAQVIPNTRLIDIHFSARDPRRAAEVVNHIVQALIDYNFQARYKANSEAAQGLNDQLSALRRHSEDLQAQLIAMQQKAGVVSSDAVDGQGRPESYSPALDRVRGASEMLLQAQASLVLKKAVYDVAKGGNAEAISTLSGTALAGSSPGVNSSFTVLQSLRNQQALLQQEIDQASTKYGTHYPRLIELQTSLSSVQDSIKQETERISRRAENDYRIAQISEEADRRIYEEARNEAVTLNGKAAEYSLLRQEAEQSRKLYDDLLNHLQEAGILQGLHASNLTVVDPARAPSKASSPKVPVTVGAALFLGLFVGFVLAFAVETVGNKVVSPRTLGTQLGAPPLAALPAFAGASASDSFDEGIRVLRARLHESSDASSGQALLVTSAIPREGKSVVALQLARSFAQRGRRTLLVEADFRAPSLAARLDLPTSVGLADLLDGSNITVMPLSAGVATSLHVLPAGQASSHAADLLDSDQMRSLLVQWRRQYDVVILDSPAVLPFSDTLPLLDQVDYTLMVVREGRVSRDQVASAVELLLGFIPGSKIGVLLNATRNSTITPNPAPYVTERALQRSNPQLRQVSSMLLMAAILTFGRGGHAQNPTLQTRTPPAPVESLLIGSGDVISIHVFGEPDLTQTLRVTDAGDVPAVLIGDVHVAGLTPGAAANAIENQLIAKQFLLHPRVNVTVDTFVTQNVSVIGQVKTAGVYPAPTGRTITDVIAQAGGLLDTADRHIVIRRRVSGQEVPFFFTNSANALLANQPLVYPGDTVFVPQAGTIYVLGDVGRPGGYIMNNPKSQLTALQALAVAGGVHTTARASQARLVRQTDDGSPREIQLALDDMRKGKVPDMVLQPEDILYVPFSYVKNVAVSLPGIIATASASAVYLAK